jgi:hypothetical protein
MTLSFGNFSMDQATSEQLKKLCNKVDRIELAVCGDDDLGATGLVKRVAAVEKKIRWWELRMATFGGALWGIFEGVKHWLSSKSGHS